MGFAASVLALVALGGLSYRTTTGLIASERQVAHTHEVIATLEAGRGILTDAEDTERGFLLTGDAQFLQECRTAQAQVDGWMQRLRSLTADNPEQQQRLDRLKPLIAQRLEALNRRIRLRQGPGTPAAVDAAGLREGKMLMGGIGDEIAAMHDTEDRLLQQRQSATQARARIGLIIILSGSALACIVGLLAVLAMQRDLKLRQQAADTVSQAGELQRLMIESIRDYAIIRLDPEGRVVSWNEGARRIKGYTAQEIVGQHFSRFYPEEIARTGFPGTKLIQAASDGRCEDESWCVRKDGSRFWAHVIISAIRDERGQLRGFTKVTRDLTDMRRVKEERDRFFEVSRDLMCVAGFDGFFKVLNPAWEKALGFSRQELLAKPFLEFVHPEDRAATLSEVERAADGEDIIYFENRYRCRDGSYRWLAWSARPAMPQSLIYATARDVTGQKKAEEHIARLNVDLQRHTQQLETANRELESFSYSVSHDLRAPLRHIDGFVKMLDKYAGEKLDERSRRYLGIIADSARRMGTLIDDLLVFSRMSRAELRRSRVALDALVHDVLEILKPDTNGRRIVWKIAPLPEVEADAAMLRQVWVNLIANAIKYSRPRDPAEIEIGCNADNGELVLFVRDNGVGFDMRYVDKLFGVFQRLHHQGEFEGTGIGLANVRRIISRHGGRTWAEGRVEGGATFFFSLPKTQLPAKG